MIKFLARLLWVVFFLLLAGVAACAVLIVKYPETGAGRFIEKYYGPVRDKVLATNEIWFQGGGEESVEPCGQPLPAEAASGGGEEPASCEKPEAPKDPFDDSNRYCGRRIGAKDLDGNVVLMYVWSVDDEQSVALLPRVERMWDGYKHKPFVVVGSHRGGRSAAAEKVVAAARLSFPVYEGARLAVEPKFSGYPFIYVVDHKGKVVYRGRSDLDATEAAVTAIGFVDK